MTESDLTDVIERARKNLADKLESASTGWLPIGGHVVNYAMTLDERDIVLAALRSRALMPLVGERSDDNLVQRCRELLEWNKTGLLHGGRNGAVRALATELESKIGSHYALSVAESQTKDDAMRELVRLASQTEEGK